mmetsp:Transcript_11038/g.35033  ORF Transcript_11038/g.35033 Transcript_11038/m.35033 type:complete len:385 (-) Transcript_11038:44-1198(-)
MYKLIIPLVGAGVGRVGRAPQDDFLLLVSSASNNYVEDDRLASYTICPLNNPMHLDSGFKPSRRQQGPLHQVLTTVREGKLKLERQESELLFKDLWFCIFRQLRETEKVSLESLLVAYEKYEVIQDNVKAITDILRSIDIDIHVEVYLDEVRPSQVSSIQAIRSILEEYEVSHPKDLSQSMTSQSWRSPVGSGRSVVSQDGYDGLKFVLKGVKCLLVCLGCKSISVNVRDMFSADYMINSRVPSCGCPSQAFPQLLTERLSKGKLKMAILRPSDIALSNLLIEGFMVDRRDRSVDMKTATELARKLQVIKDDVNFIQERTLVLNMDSFLAAKIEGFERSVASCTRSDLRAKLLKTIELFTQIRGIVSEKYDDYFSKPTERLRIA